MAQPTNSKKISTDLFGLFFEDINYSADGGLYAEMVQNRSFEYTPADNRQWHALSFWDYISPGFSYGKLDIETSTPLNANNPHYAVLTIEHIGAVPERSAGRPGQPLPNSVTIGRPGVGIKNAGFANTIVKEGEQYNFSLFAKLLSDVPVEIYISLQNTKGKTLAENNFTLNRKDWNQYSATLSAKESCDSTQIVVTAVSKGKIALDMVSLFPVKTFNNRANGLRPDLAKLLADMKPRFIRFPGGCLAHGDGVGNMYRWKNTIGPVEQRVAQKNLWGYHQTVGLGYFEYFQFCEDIGAKPLPVLPAGVSCQNSGGTWRIGGTGQQPLPLDEMQGYIQEVLDLIEWANGPATSVWGAKRAAAGHPAPFNLKYVGIGNEDKITPEFEQRFTMIYQAVKAKHPEIEIIGTSGPFHSGEDFNKGWVLANKLQVPIVDEHYYVQPEWLISNHYRYDKYNRDSGEVYLGEYASWGNKLKNAIAEASYMTSLERNGDIVRMASYAPLFAKKGFTQWTTDMIFFDNATACLTPNYYVQKLFSINQGDYYVDKVITKDLKDSTLAASCVYDSKTGDIILKLVNYDTRNSKTMKVDLSKFKKIETVAERTVLAGDAYVENTIANPHVIEPSYSSFTISKAFTYQTPAMSLTVIRIKTKK
ncbi:MAG TPA: alpha-L-arabinofuranosidase C-terminal domain-containing protein [Phnomibacter sp.]|nr:alpha-L-arabinofuranosidase C-terminal domain-containing protein [Phnomibacter sp.]